MGQLIDFGGGKVQKKAKPEPKLDDVIGLLPRLRFLKDEAIVVHIDQKIIKNDDLLKKVIKDVITIRCMGAITIIIPDSDAKVSEYFVENGYADPLANANFTSTTGITDVIDVLIKHDSAKKIGKIINNYNTIGLVISGLDLNIVFPDEIVNKNVETMSFTMRQMYNSSVQKKANYSIDTLNEIIKTDIIPVIVPTFRDQQGNEYMLESNLFAMYLAKYLNALKYVSVYSDNQQIPTSCIYGAERFTKIVRDGNFDSKTMKILNAAIEAVKNGVQGSHVVAAEGSSIIEEFCNGNTSGLYLYDDTLNHL